MSICNQFGFYGIWPWADGRFQKRGELGKGNCLWLEGVGKGEQGNKKAALKESDLTGSKYRCLESRFAVRSDSKRHRSAATSNRAIRIARPKTVRIAVKASPFFTFKIGFKSRNLIR